MGAMPRRQLLSGRTGADWREVRGTIERVGGPERGDGWIIERGGRTIERVGGLERGAVRTVEMRWEDYRQGVGGP